MEQIAQIQKVFPDGTAEVIRLMEGNCSGNCTVCGGCEPKPFLAHNPIDAKPGDRVHLEPDAKVSRIITTMLFTIPPVLLLAGYLLGEHLWSRGTLIGLTGGVLGLGLVMMQDKRLSKKYPITYTITALAKEEEA